MEICLPRTIFWKEKVNSLQTNYSFTKITIMNNVLIMKDDTIMKDVTVMKDVTIIKQFFQF